MPEPDRTLRYRAPSRYVYSAALLALFEFCRSYDGVPFAFGPLSLDARESSGLVVSGPDLGPVTDVLSRVPGLVQLPD